MNLASGKMIFPSRLTSILTLFAIINLIGALLFLNNALASPITSSSNTTDSFWTNVSSMPTPRSESGVAILEDKIYVAGGESQAIKKTNVVEVYDLRTKKWSHSCSVTNGDESCGNVLI